MNITYKAGEPFKIPDHLEYDLDKCNFATGVVMLKERTLLG